jgi:DNA-binding NtrC family response regulator
LVAGLMRRHWPGNVRELRSAASQLAVRIRAGRPIELDELGGELEAAPAEAHAPLDDATLVATLREHRFQLGRTAEALGISRTHLDALIARSPNLRKAKDLTRDEIAACAAALGDDLEAMAAKLEVSARGLRLRMRQLGL